MQSAGDGSRGEREGVYVFANFFEALFGGYAEALFFSDDHQAEILKAHIFGEQAVRADDDIDFARFEGGENLFLLRGGTKAAEHLDAHGKSGEAALEGFEMLESKDGRWGEDSDLLGIGDGFESGTHGHFGLAVTDVAAEQAVHGRGAFH